MNRRSGIQIVKNLIGLVKPMLPVMIIAIIMGVVGFLASISITTLGAQTLIDIFDGHTKDVSFFFFLIILFGVSRGFLRYIEQASNHYIAFKLLAIIRDKVFKKLRSLAPAKLDGKEKGNLISMITSDVELLEVFYAHTISPVMIALIVSLIIVIYISNMHWILGIVTSLAFITVGIFIPLLISKQGKKDGMKQRTLFGKLNSYVLESIHGLQEIVQFNRGLGRLQTLTEKSNELDTVQKALKRREGTQRGFTDTAIMLFTIIIFFASLLLYENGEIEKSTIVIATVALASSFGPVSALSNLANNLLVTFASGERILNLLEEQPIVDEVKSGCDEEFESLQMKQVNFTYGKTMVLEDINLSIEKNKIIGIQGKSGSGKTTLVKLFMRFFDPTNGEVMMNRENLKGWSSKALRHNLSYVTQEAYLFHDTIKANIAIAKQNASDEEIIEACIKANIHDFIMSLEDGYNTNTGDLGERVSGGQRQRIGLARAFLSDAPLMLLDEPTSNLDSLNEAIIIKTIKENVDEKTVVLVSHRDSSLKIADELITVENGRKS